MRIAFYAPLKPPDHPVPSGDRQMARLLMAALRHAGHTVELASGFRSYRKESSGEDSLFREAGREVDRLAALWTDGAPPDLWFCYHNYYKAPDLLGPPLCRAFAIPYVTAEASYAGKRELGEWAGRQRLVRHAVQYARLNICFTARDKEGLEPLAAPGRLAHLPPFIDVSGFARAAAYKSRVPRLVTVAMMRPGDKMDSYAMLAAALSRLADRNWTLTVAGDGPARDDVRAVFARLPAGRIAWLGETAPEAVPGILAGCDILVWPGFGEAFGLAYLEAQAAGLPVVAQKTAGVPEVVNDGMTGVLTPRGDVDAFAAAIAVLLADPDRRARMGAAARRFVHDERSIEGAAARLSQMLESLP